MKYILKLFDDVTIENKKELVLTWLKNEGVSEEKINSFREALNDLNNDVENELSIIKLGENNTIKSTELVEIINYFREEESRLTNGKYKELRHDILHEGNRRYEVYDYVYEWINNR